MWIRLYPSKAPGKFWEEKQLPQLDKTIIINLWISLPGGSQWDLHLWNTELNPSGKGNSAQDKEDFQACGKSFSVPQSPKEGSGNAEIIWKGVGDAGMTK